jgi:hypothetical protein
MAGFDPLLLEIFAGICCIIKAGTHTSIVSFSPYFSGFNPICLSFHVLNNQLSVSAPRFFFHFPNFKD